MLGFGGSENRRTRGEAFFGHKGGPGRQRAAGMKRRRQFLILKNNVMNHEFIINTIFMRTFKAQIFDFKIRDFKIFFLILDFLSILSDFNYFWNFLEMFWKFFRNALNFSGIFFLKFFFRIFFEFFSNFFEFFSNFFRIFFDFFSNVFFELTDFKILYIFLFFF